MVSVSNHSAEPPWRTRRCRPWQGHAEGRGLAESFENLSSNCSLIWAEMGTTVTLMCPVRHADVPILGTSEVQKPAWRQVDTLIRRESPERAEPSLVGVWGNPQYPTHPSSRQGSGRASGGGNGRTAVRPYGSAIRSSRGGGSTISAPLVRRWPGRVLRETRVERNSETCAAIRRTRWSGGRVQRGQSPLWWGLEEPPTILSAPLPAREACGPSGDGRRGADSVIPTRPRGGIWGGAP